MANSVKLRSAGSVDSFNKQFTTSQITDDVHCVKSLLTFTSVVFIKNKNQHGVTDRTAATNSLLTYIYIFISEMIPNKKLK